MVRQLVEIFNRIYNTATGAIKTEETEYTTIIDEVSATTVYYGWAAVNSSTANAVWKIKRKSVSGTVTTYAYADGNTNYDNIWDNRALLSYS
jgi:hypothetical protein